VPEWTAEIEVDAGLARRLIAGQFPGLAIASLAPFAEGWDNAVWLVNGELLFRFPRRAIAVPGVEREMAVLPLLAPLVPVAIPAVAYAGVPAGGYPWPFFGTPLLPGREASEVVLDDDARVGLGRPLALFLRALHAGSVARAMAGHPLPVDPNGRADMVRRVARTRRQLDEVARLGLWEPGPPALELLEEAAALGSAGSEVVVHGDLHFRHLLVGGDGALTGVIDWGDVCRGSRSIDLQLFWSFLPPAGRTAFLGTYGAVSDDELLRARVLALSLNALLATYGHEAGLPKVEREAVTGLRRTMVGSPTLGEMTDDDRRV